MPLFPDATLQSLITQVVMLSASVWPRVKSRPTNAGKWFPRLDARGPGVNSEMVIFGEPFRVSVNIQLVFDIGMRDQGARFVFGFCKKVDENSVPHIEIINVRSLEIWQSTCVRDVPTWPANLYT